MKCISKLGFIRNSRKGKRQAVQHMLHIHICNGVLSEGFFNITSSQKDNVMIFLYSYGHEWVFAGFMDMLGAMRLALRSSPFPTSPSSSPWRSILLLFLFADNQALSYPDITHKRTAHADSIRSSLPHLYNAWINMACSSFFSSLALVSLVSKVGGATCMCFKTQRTISLSDRKHIYLPKCSRFSIENPHVNPSFK